MSSRTARRAAERASEAAGEADARGARLSGAKKALRDSMIVARAALRVPWEEIAEEAGISARQCERIVADRRAVPSLLDEQPMALVEGLVRDFRASIADFEALAFEYSGSNPTAALGAKKAADEARARMVALLGNIGKLPSNLELFRSEMEMMRLADEMGRALVALRDGEATVEQVIDFFRALATQRERRQLTIGAA